MLFDIFKFRGSIAIIRKKRRQVEIGSGATRRTGVGIKLFFAIVSRQLVRDNWSADALEP